jgi:ABC-2 type transport system ATP-binding protein
MKIIDIKNLTKSYGKNRGIENINLTVNEKEIFGFIGPNGAGKSTTIKVLLNFIFPTHGEAKIFDLDCVKDSVKIKENIGYVPSEVRYYGNMKVRDIISYGESFHNNVDKEYVQQICKDFSIELDKNISELSLGNKKKVAIIQAILNKPKLLILDEPTNGLDPLIQQKLFETLTKLKNEGSTIFFSSHNLSEVEEFCDKVAIIKEGKIIDIKDIREYSRKKIKKITIKTMDIIEEELISLGIENLEKNNQVLTFYYSGAINPLLSLLSKYKIEDLTIEEKNLSETFMSYYYKEDK